MNKKLLYWQLAGFLATSLLGTLLHFAYDWSGQSLLIAPFSGVNESTWEHMKLLFYPLLIFATIESRYLEQEYPSFWCTKAIGTLFGLLMIPALFYTYNGTIGPSPDWLNIAIFYITAALVYLLEWWLFRKAVIPCRANNLAVAVFCLSALLFTLFTWLPPTLPLFQDPETLGYGIK